MSSRPWDCEAHSARIPFLARIFGKRVWSEDSGYWVKGIWWGDVLYVTDSGFPEEPDAAAPESQGQEGGAG